MAHEYDSGDVWDTFHVDVSDILGNVDRLGAGVDTDVYQHGSEHVLCFTRQPSKFDMLEGQGVDVARYYINSHQWEELKEQGVVCLFTMPFMEQPDEELWAVLEEYESMMAFTHSKEEMQERFIEDLLEIPYDALPTYRSVHRAAMRAIDAALEASPVSGIGLDIHAAQFLVHNGEIVCIDPSFDADKGIN